MATPILTQISKDLAIKLQDPPISPGTGDKDGIRVTAAQRLLYITRGYRKLLRFITTLYPDFINKLFTNYYVPVSTNSDSAGLIAASTYAEVSDLFCKTATSTKYTKATFIEADNFNSLALEDNSFFIPSIANQKFYWSIIQNVINILPITTYNVKFTCRLDVIALVEAGGYTGSTDIDVLNIHTDMLLALAASEAYLDLGQPELSNAHMQQVIQELNILVKIDQKKED